MSQKSAILDKIKIDEFWVRRATQPDPRVATHFKIDTALEHDVAFIKQHLPANSHVLELGCGTGAIVNLIASDCAYIKAIDKVPEFLSHCVISNHVSIEAGDIVNYKDNHQYDVILIFGVMNYVEEFEARLIYANCHAMLKPGGKLIVKNACGIEKDIVVDKFSQEIGQWYHAVYRYYGKEKSLLSTSFKNIEVYDIYPSTLNRWNDTHFYAFVAVK